MNFETKGVRFGCKYVFLKFRRLESVPEFFHVFVKSKFIASMICEAKLEKRFFVTLKMGKRSGSGAKR